MAKKKPKTKRQKLYDDLDKAWADAVKDRDGECLVCEKSPPDVVLNAHHWIKRKAQSLKHKWDLRNGVTLCFRCHIHRVHKGELAAIDKMKEEAFKRDITTRETYEEIKGYHSKGEVKYYIGDLEEKIREFQEM